MQYDNRTAGERLWYDESFYDVADFEVDEEFDEEADLLRWFEAERSEEGSIYHTL